MLHKKFAAATTATVASLLAAGLAGPTAVYAASPNSTLHGSQPAWAHDRTAQAAVAGSNHVGFAVYLGWQSDAAAFAESVSTPGSASYRKYLTPQQFRARFSPSASQVGAVTKWLKAQGFTIDYTPQNNLFVDAEGTVAQANAAFATTIGQYSYDGLTLDSPESDLQIQTGLGITGVTGLDDSSELVHPDTSTPAAPPSAGFVNGGPCSSYWGQLTTADTQEPTPLDTTTATITSPAAVTLPGAYNSTDATPFATCGYTPDQLRGAYGLTSAQTGAGQTVAIVDAYASPTIQSDANEYFTNHSDGGLIPQLNGSNFTQVVAPGTYQHPEEGKKQDPEGWYGEETLDVEAVHSMAPDAHIVYVGAPNNYRDLDQAVNTVVDKGLASMVTDSWGNTGEDVPQGSINADSMIFEQAAAEGIGVYFSSGDNGDETGGNGSLASASPDWPASSPWVTAVGGTSLAVGADDTRLNEWGWETGKSKLAGSDASSLSWSPAAPGAYDYGSGGGTSRIEAQPAYQAGVVPTSMSEIYGGSTPARVVPDVSALGDPTTGMLVGQTQTFPDGVRYGEYRIGGTSLASPLFTGMMADVQAARGSDIGFANPLLYANAATAFMDILPVSQTNPPAVVRSDFTNTVDATSGYTASIRSIDYDQPLTIHVAQGYDDVTGIGSPGPAFFSVLSQ